MIAVHGGGYVGLTAAVHWALAGETVVVYDPDTSVVDGINSGRPKSGEFLGYVASLDWKSRVSATTVLTATLSADVHVIAVPTERHGEPHDGIIMTVLLRLLWGVRKGALLCVESTLTPGTIDAVLQEFRAVDRKIGRDLFLAVCPRRDWFADPEKNLQTLPRVVGGVTPACTDRAVDALGRVSQVILRTDYHTAEITKSLENALLHVPVMFAHELALAYPNRNIAEALRLAGTHWRLTPLYLNFGTGGRCVPLGTKSLRLGWLMNSYSLASVPITDAVLNMEEDFRFTVAQTLDAMSDGDGPILIMGVAYRPEFRDAGLSPALDVARHLIRKGRTVVLHDPMWEAKELAAMMQMPGASAVDAVTDVARYAAVALATPHKRFLDWPLGVQWRSGQFVLDAQAAWLPHAQYLRGLGVRYAYVGMPGWTRINTSEMPPP